MLTARAGAVLAARQRYAGAAVAAQMRWSTSSAWDFVSSSSSSPSPSPPSSKNASSSSATSPDTLPIPAPSAVLPSAQPAFDAPNPTPSLHDWSRSFHGLASEAFPSDVISALLAPLSDLDVEIKPDGLLYLPEIKYRRILNRSFGPGAWGLAPRSETNVGSKVVSREYGLVCLGRLVGVARGEQEYFDPSGVPTATEGCKSNALMRCCKDLGIASELWDPRYIRDFKAKHCTEVWAEHVIAKKKRKLWRRKDDKLSYPYEEK
ncbi:MAG: hypothetical protein CYPHOPRED_003166 [Cyphobasidiales sp. Tagirdzhanova-0007]|nr:MAG: hypothetical protein CYPHOPRED_003166 [Cyphobasidiales sp. Tagirdzhanova-0007]